MTKPLSPEREAEIRETDKDIYAPHKVDAVTVLLQALDAARAETATYRHEFKMAQASMPEVAKLRARIEKLEEERVLANAELIYLRLYGKDGAIWTANNSKDVWIQKAREALAADKETEE